MKLSLIIAGYRHPEIWANALESVRRIPILDMEFLCVEDGGGDSRVMDLLKAYHEKDVRFVPIYRDNGGVCCARNTALDRARGEYVTFMDYDDEVNANIYNRAILFLDAHSDCDICAFGVNTIWPDLRLQDPVSFEGEFVIKDRGPDLYRSVTETFEKKRLLNYIWNKLYRRDFLEQHKIRFAPHAVCYEDVIFNLNCLIKGAVIGGIKGIGYYWMRPSSGTTLSRYRQWDAEGVALALRAKTDWVQYCGVDGDDCVKNKLLMERKAYSMELIKNMYRVGSTWRMRERCRMIREVLHVGILNALIIDVVKNCAFALRKYFYYDWVRTIKMRLAFDCVKKYSLAAEIVRE